MSTAPSNIRVFVQFKEATVFAGDKIECTITYKNVETSPKVVKRGSVGASPRIGTTLRRASQGATSPPSTPARPTPSRQASGSSPKGNASKPGQVEKPTLSLNVVDSLKEDEEHMLSPSSINVNEATNTSRNERKVSILSLGNQSRNTQIRRTSQLGTPRTPPFSHRRSSSATNLPGSPNTLSPSVAVASRSPFPKSPLSATSPMTFLTEPDFLTSAAESPSRRLSQNPPKLSRVASAGAVLRSPTRLETSPDRTQEKNGQRKKRVPAITSLPGLNPPPQTKSISETPPMSPVDHAPSIASLEHTPRSSIDVFNSMNDSNDTLASENASKISNTNSARLPNRRTPSSLGSAPLRNRTETLMMGFAQISGSFTLDGSLVNESDFEEVKRKAVVGGQGGGGVVGIETKRQSGGIFGSLGWGSLSQSIGGLMGGSELSTIKEMKNIADSKSIPLIATPKSILFVDLQLAPGESRSYTFSFTLPRGLPPSHKGRAMKVVYNLVVGTQRPSLANARQQQAIRTVEVPFRVFGGVNVQGEVLGHNLMSPYIILRDQARTSAIEGSQPTSTKKERTTPKRRPSQYASGLAEFQTYVNYLLDNPRKNSSFGLLSPTGDVNNRRSSYVDVYAPKGQPSSTRELIDLAVRHSGMLYGSDQSQTNFTIARASQLVARVILSRPAFKLGDTVSCIVDFTSAQTLCYGLEMTLESSEKVDPSFAIRSTQSVERATRRSWARMTESTFWSKKCVFNAQIPSTATPTFSTTGIGLDWCVRVEFIVAKHSDDEHKTEDSGESTEEESRRKVEHLMDEISSDERGVTLSAASYLACESFEITVPIRVFGAAIGDVENGTGSEGLSI